jgi:hypothetical protein
MRLLRFTEPLPRVGWSVCCIAAWLSGACAADSGTAPVPRSNQAQAELAQPVIDDGFSELLALDWELEPETEKYLCVRSTLTQTSYLNAIQPLSPLGTHHVTLTINDQPDAPDGARECDAAEVAPRSLGGGGVGTKTRFLPDGVAMQLSAGNQVLLNLHLFNTSDQSLRGRSGVSIHAVDVSAVRELADGMIIGATRLDVPPGRSTSVGRCTLDRAGTFLSVFPHMHQTGSRSRSSPTAVPKGT